MTKIALGKSWIHIAGDGEATFVGAVTGGGAHGPGSVTRFVDYSATVRERFDSDDRSGSRRSGSCAWSLRPNTFYRLTDVATSNSGTDDYCVVTGAPGEEPRFLKRSAFDAERRSKWPESAAAHDVAEAEAARKAEEAERVRIAAAAERRAEEERYQARLAEEAAARRAANDEAADKIAREGQDTSDGLPALKGTPKQIAWALTIRAKVAAKNPKDPSLKKGKTAKYWIENHRYA